MGQAISTAGLVGFATLLLVVMAILIIVSNDRITKSTNFGTNQNLQRAHDKLVIAQILTWISAALALILVFGYFVIHAGWTNNEWIHLILWIGIFGTLIAAIVLLAIALGDIDRSNTDTNSSASWAWGAIGVAIGAFVILLISGGWRIVTITTKPNKKKIYKKVPIGSVKQPHTLRVTSTGNGGSITSIKSGQGYQTISEQV